VSGITTLAEYQTSIRQKILYTKSGTSWGSGAAFYSNVQISGSPAAAAAPGNSANGIVPVSPATGYPTINSAGARLFITGVEASLLSSGSTFAGYRYILADLLFYAGGYTLASNVTLASQPSFASRMPGGAYAGTQIWVEQVPGSGSSSPANYTIGYTNQGGTAGRSTGAVSVYTGSNVGLSAVQIPLQSGDGGVQKIESVVGSGGGSLSANVMVVRPLVYGRVDWPRRGGVQRKWFDKITPVEIFGNSALVSIVQCEGSGSTLTTAPLELEIEVSASVFPTTSGVTWNPSDASVNTVLSDGNLTASVSGAGAGQVRANSSKSNGKYYYETVLISSSSSSPFMGVRPTSTALGGNGPFDAAGDVGCYMRSPNDGYETYRVGSNVAAVGPAYVGGDVFMFATDLVNSKLWVGRNGTWSAGDPATNTGGIPFSAGAYSPWKSGGVITARFDPASFSYTPPTGFGPWT
jgi:hypothetical protein